MAGQTVLQPVCQTIGTDVTVCRSVTYAHLRAGRRYRLARSARTGRGPAERCAKKAHRPVFAWLCRGGDDGARRVWRAWMNRPLTTCTDSAISSARATAAAMGSIVLWSASGVCYRAGAEMLGDMPYLSISCVVGVLTIAALERLRGRPVGDVFRPPLRVITAGFFGVALYSVMLATAVGMADERDVGHVMLLNYLWPIWIVLLGLILWPGRTKALPAVCGTLLGFVGVAVARGWQGLAHLPANPLPHALAAAGGFMWALYSVLLRTWRVPPERGGSTFHFAVCAVMAAIIGVVRGQWQWAPLGRPGTWLLVLFAGVGPVGLAYYWWEIGMKRGAAQLIATLSYFIPVGSIVLIALFYRQAWGAMLLPGAALVAAGAWLSARAAERGG